MLGQQSHLHPGELEHAGVGQARQTQVFGSVEIEHAPTDGPELAEALGQDGNVAETVEVAVVDQVLAVEGGKDMLGESILFGADTGRVGQQRLEIAGWRQPLGISHLGETGAVLVGEDLLTQQELLLDVSIAIRVEIQLVEDGKVVTVVLEVLAELLQSALQEGHAVLQAEHVDVERPELLRVARETGETRYPLHRAETR